MSLQTELRHVIHALADALDLVGVDDVAHGKRVGIMAAACAGELGADAVESAFLFDLGMLHDIGVSSTRTHQHLVTEFDWEGAQGHAETGYALLKDYPPLADMALPVRYHHTHWSELVASSVDPLVARRANLIYLVDRVDALAAPYYASNAVLKHMAAIRDEIAAACGKLLCARVGGGFSCRFGLRGVLVAPRAALGASDPAGPTGRPRGLCRAAGCVA